MILFNFLTDTLLYKKYRQNFVLKQLSNIYFNYYFFLNGIQDRNLFFFFFNSYYKMKLLKLNKIPSFSFFSLLKKKKKFADENVFDQDLEMNDDDEKKPSNFRNSDDDIFQRFVSMRQRDRLILIFKICFFFFRLRLILKFIFFGYFFLYILYYKIGLNFYYDPFLNFPTKIN